MAELYTMSTPNPCHEFKFSWSIDNFSATPKSFDGPAFAPIPETKGTFCFEICFLEGYPTVEESRMRVLLKIVDDYNENVCVGSSITLRNAENNTMHTSCTDVKMIDTATLLMDKVFNASSKKGVCSSLDLVDDKLNIEGTLTFYVFVKTSNACKKESNSDARDELVGNLGIMYASFHCKLMDVMFCIDGKKIYAHKALLIYRSPVFKDMFKQDMLDEVIIKDVEIDVFDQFIGFLYTGELEDETWDTAISMYSLADKYHVKSLQKVCSEILGKSLVANSACSVLLLADLHKDNRLKRKVNYFIAENLEVFGTKEWAEVVVGKPDLVREVMDFVKWYSKCKWYCKSQYGTMP